MADDRDPYDRSIWFPNETTEDPDAPLPEQLTAEDLPGIPPW